MPRITFKDGRWIDLRLPTVDEYLDIQDLPLTKGRAAYNTRLRFWRDTFKNATRETSWGGHAGELGVMEMLAIAPQWLYAMEDDAVPLALGSASEKRPRTRRSRAQTASEQSTSQPDSSSS